MASCELQKPIVHGAQMERWLGLSERHDPLFPNLTLKPKSEQRLFQALSDLEHVQDIGNVYGRHTLKNVLQCFEPVSALRTPPNKHTGGDTLYAQVAAAYDAYRTGMLDSDAMKTVEDFTYMVLFAVAGNTKTPSDYVSSLTYKKELFAGSIEKTHYETDALGEQALRTLDHVYTLFECHHHQIDTAHNNQKLPVQSGLALPAKVTGALVAIELFITGCTTAVSPTISPTTEATRPALTAPLPTAEHTKTPTLTPTPTEAPTPTAVALPESSSPYPGSLPDELHTTESIAREYKAFTELIQANNDVAKESQIISTNLLALAKQEGIKNPIITGYVDGQRWGMILSDENGTIYFVMTKDGLPVADVGAYSELISKKFTPDNYSLQALKLPADIAPNSTIVPIETNGWVVYAYVGSDGQIIAWFNAIKGEYTKADGEILENVTTYTPYEPGVTTLEVVRNNVITWPGDNPAQFENDLAKLHKFDIPVDNSDLASWPELAPNYRQITNFPDGWLYFGLRTEYITTTPRPSIVASLSNPYGHDMIVVMTQINVQLANGERRQFSLPVVRDTAAVLKVIENVQGKDSKRYKLETSEKYVQSLFGADTVFILSFISKSKQPLFSSSLPTEFQALALVHDYNLTNGVLVCYERVINGEGTDEDIAFLIKHALLQTGQTRFEDDPAYTPVDKRP